MQVGAAIVASRFVVAEVPPLTLAMLRYAVGFLCLLPFAWSGLRTLSLPGRNTNAVGKSFTSDLLAMAALGIGQFGVLIALLNFGLQHVGAAQAAMIFSLFPLPTGALCSVLYRAYLQRYPTVPVSAFAMLASVAVLALLALAEGWPARIGGLSVQAWVIVGFIGLSSGGGYFLWLYALKHESPTRVTVFLALNPVTAALLGAWLLHEPFTPWAGAALVLVAAGLWLATRTALRGQR